MYGMFQPSHLILILIVVLIIFGPGKMKGLGKSLGESLRDFKMEMNKTGEDKEEKAENNAEPKS